MKVPVVVLPYSSKVDFIEQRASDFGGTVAVEVGLEYEK
jgi:hypothetical protein